MPPLTDEEYQSLKADIRLRGVLVSLEFDDVGNILDGHTRNRIIMELRAEGVRVDHQSIIRPGLTEPEKRAHVRALNLQRRHLTPVQRRNLIAQQLQETPEKSDRLVASQLHVDRETVGKVRGVLEATGGIPPLEERVGADGKARRKPGSASVIARNEKETHRALEALDGMRSGVLPRHPVDVRLLERYRRETDSADRAKGVETEPSVIGGAEIRLGDFRVVLNDVAAESASLILTDPPYAREYLPLWDDLALFAARVLRPGGFLVVYSGQSYLPAVLAALSHHLEYIWTIAQIGQGRKTHNYHLNIYANWKPILVFAKPPFEPGRWFDDVLIGDALKKASTIGSRAKTRRANLWRCFPGLETS